MKRIFNKFDMLPQKKKMALVTAVVMTLSLIITIPAYAWFMAERKAAEMYKVEYPNALYLNAAHREDRAFFNMNAISKYKIDPVTGGLAHDTDGKVIPVTEQNYVFSVSGKNTSRYILQLAHTNNNEYDYTIYKATQYKNKPEGVSDDDIVEYKMNLNSHTENELQVDYDQYDDTESGILYYQIGNAIAGSDMNPGDTPAGSSYRRASKSTSDKYYRENFTNDTTASIMTDVDDDDVPSYWLSDTIDVSYADKDSGGRFCHYYVIKVTWTNRSNSIEKKETDMVYLTAERL